MQGFHYVFSASQIPIVFHIESDDYIIFPGTAEVHDRDVCVDNGLRYYELNRPTGVSTIGISLL